MGIVDFAAGLGDGQRVGCHGDCDSHLDLAQRRRIVSTVAAHADGVTSLLKCFDELVLVLRQNAREDRELLGMDIVRDRAGRADDAINAHRPRDAGCRSGRIASHHHGAESPQFADERSGVFARWVAEGGGGYEASGSELTAIHEGVDVALRQRFLQTVLRGALGDEILLVLERG